MAMRRIVQSLGGRTFRAVYARAQPTHQQGPTFENKSSNPSPHANKDTYAAPQHRSAPYEETTAWEKIKDDISINRPGAQQSQQPWMEKAKEKLTQAAEFVKGKTQNIDAKNLSQTAESLKEGAKDKLAQAGEFIKEKASIDTTNLSQSAESLKEAAKDKLSQAQEFVRKQTIGDSAAKDAKVEEKFTAEQKKKITEEAWDFSKFKSQQADLAKDSKSSSFENKQTIGSGKQQTADSTDSFSNKLKSELKDNKERILNESVGSKMEKNFIADKVEKRQ